MDAHNTSYHTINHPPTKESEQLPPAPVNLLDLPFIGNCIQLKERRKNILGESIKCFSTGFLEPRDEQIASFSWQQKSGECLELVENELVEYAVRPTFETLSHLAVCHLGTWQ